MLIYQSISVVAWTTGGHGQKLLLPVLGMAVPQLGSRGRRDETSGGRGGPGYHNRARGRAGGAAGYSPVLQLVAQICLCPRPVASSTSAHRLVCQRASAVRLRSLCFFFDPPTHPGNRCSGEQGGGCSCSEWQWSGERAVGGACKGHKTQAAAGVRERAHGALAHCQFPSPFQ